MSFNRGFFCKDHGPMEKAGTRNKRNICLICSKDVQPWEKPITERPGRCSLCGCGGFKQALYKSDFLTQCHDCKQVYNVDKKKVVTKGNVDNVEKNRKEREERSKIIREEMERKGEN